MRKQILKAKISKKNDLASQHWQKAESLKATAQHKFLQVQATLNEVHNISDPQLQAFILSTIITLKNSLEALSPLSEDKNYSEEVKNAKIKCLEMTLVCTTMVAPSRVFDLAAELCSLSPENPIASSILGMSYYQNGEYKKASKYLKKINKTTDKFYLFLSQALSFDQKTADKRIEENFLAAAAILEKSPDKFSSNTVDQFYMHFGNYLYLSDANRESEALALYAKGGKVCQHQYGLGLLKKKDLESSLKAQELFRKSLAQGWAAAKEDLGWSLFHDADEKNIEEGYQLLEEIPTLPPHGQMNLAGYLVYSGKDIDKGIKIARSAIEMGAKKDPEIRFELGVMLLFYGNIAEGVQLIQKTASENYSHAKNLLGFLYEFGLFVEIDSLLAETLMREAALTCPIALNNFKNFLSRRIANRLISEEEAIAELKTIKDRGKYEDPPNALYMKIDHSSINPEKNNQIESKAMLNINKVLAEITQDPKLYPNEKIRALFSNIRYLRNSFTTKNATAFVFQIGKIFSRIPYMANDLIKLYAGEMLETVEFISKKAPLFTSTQIALLFDGISKLHLNFSKTLLDHSVYLLINYAKTKIVDFNKDDLSMMVSGLIRMTVARSILTENLKLFLGKIQNLWKQYDNYSLIHFAYMFAILDVSQSTRQTRLISKRLLNQLFREIYKEIFTLQLDKSSSSQLNLALRYFSQRYPQDQAAMPALYQLRQSVDEKLTNLSPVCVSNFQFQVTKMIKQAVFPQPIKAEFPINGLMVDVVKDNLAIQIDGPSHFCYELEDKLVPQQTATDKFHDALLELAKYRVIHIPYFEWQKLPNSQAQLSYLREKGIYNSTSVAKTTLSTTPSIAFC